MSAQGTVSQGPQQDLAIAAFGSIADHAAANLLDAIRAAADHLTMDQRAGELVLDKRALLIGILTTANSTRARRARSSAGWLFDWLVDKVGIELPRGNSDAIAAAVATMRVTLSRSVLGVILPRARDIAEKTTNLQVVGVRHVLIALLLDSDDLQWADICTRPLTPADCADAIRHIVERITDDAPSHERVDVWREIAGLPPLAPRPADAPASSETSSLTPPPPRHALRTLADNPATADQLGRASFARVLAERLREAHAPNRDNSENGAFMAHIHGPWGYGKSSVLNFLRQELEAGPDPWLVVEFNAWKHHRLRPPWWSLISAVYAAARRAPEVRGNWKRRRIWLGWKLRSDFPTALSYLAVPLGALFLGVGLLNDMSDNLAVIAGVITAVGLIVGTIRTLSFGSAKAAEAYAEMKTDPYQPVVSLYCKLVRSIGRPVAVFVDDLDRCDAAYVVDLVEGIQTLLRSEPVTYVIAAERKWICSAFEKKYADFSGPIGEPARPLGYLFLDKLFQISAALPRISPEMRKGYWSSLLDGAPAAPAATTLTAADAEARVSGKTSVEALQQVIAEAPEADKQMLRAAAAVEITRPATQDAIEHSLQPFADLLEPNPRAMKRLVNAVGMAQARAFLEARDASLDTLARWTLVELRWPLLADHLAANIDAVEFARDAAAGKWPGAIAPLAADPHVRAVLAPEAQPGLDAKLLRELLA